VTRHSLDGAVLYRCDCCHRALWLRDDEDLPSPWREVLIDGWVGSFECCSDACEIRYRNGDCL
jgi:hypothetical protein